jgi:hypothetical protein
MTFKIARGPLLALCLASLVACRRGEAYDDVAADRFSAVPAIRSLAKGTSVVVALVDAIRSGSAHAGDGFAASLVADARDAAGTVQIPSGTLVRGTITEVTAPSSGTSLGTATLAIGTVEVEGRTYLLDASIGSLEAEDAGRGGETASPTGSDADLVFPSGSRMVVTLNEGLILSP